MSLMPVGDWLSGASALNSYRELANSLDDALAERGEGTLREMHAQARELVEHALGRLVLGAEHGRMAMARLREIGPPSELLEVAPAEAASAALLDRVLLSRLENGFLWAESLYVAEDPAGTARLLDQLQAAPVKLDYPLVEWEVLRRRRPLLVCVDEVDDQQRHAFGSLMRWRRYVASPLILEGRVVGFLHGDTRGSGRVLTEVDRDALGMFAVAFPAVYELAVLRHRLRTQRQEMRQVALWADTRTSELSDRAVTLNPDSDSAGSRNSELALPAAELLDKLTRREYDVLRLMADGESNGNIAQQLFVSVGTVKFHVKNIFRKMGASNRSELVALYLRMTVSGKRG
jgi:LuxR family transcriptional regulator, regulator of acetate metabolism